MTVYHFFAFGIPNGVKGEVYCPGRITIDGSLFISYNQTIFFCELWQFMVVKAATRLSKSRGLGLYCLHIATGVTFYTMSCIQLKFLVSM